MNTSYVPTPPPETPIPTPTVTQVITDLATTGATTDGTLLAVWVGAGLVALGALSLVVAQARKTARRSAR